MLRFQLFGFPVFVHWMFWLNCVLLSGRFEASSPQQIQLLLGWVAVVFVSILIHELGHAFAMRHYGDRRVGVILYAFGGLAKGSQRLSRRQDIVVSAAGPFVQIAFGVALWWLADLWQPHHWLVTSLLDDTIYVSIFWAVLNLLPIVPLDGGRISLALLGPQRARLALKISLACAVVLGVWALTSNLIFSAIFCGMLAFNNWRSLQGQPEVPWMAAR